MSLLFTPSRRLTRYECRDHQQPLRTTQFQSKARPSRRMRRRSWPIRWRIRWRRGAPVGCDTSLVLEHPQSGGVSRNSRPFSGCSFEESSELWFHLIRYYILYIYIDEMYGSVKDRLICILVAWSANTSDSARWVVGMFKPKAHFPTSCRLLYVVVFFPRTFKITLEHPVAYGPSKQAGNGWRCCSGRLHCILDGGRGTSQHEVPEMKLLVAGGNVKWFVQEKNEIFHAVDIHHDLTLCPTCLRVTWQYFLPNMQG